MGWRCVAWISVGQRKELKKKTDSDNSGGVGNHDWLKHWGPIFESLLIIQERLSDSGSCSGNGAERNRVNN